MFASLNSKLYTVAALREIADRMGLEIKGKITKAVLAGIIADAIDIVHRDVLDTMEIVKIAETGSYLKSEPKSYTERSISRSLTYARQNGYDTDAIDDVYPSRHFTPKQRRRAAKKYNAQYAKLSASLS